MKRVNKSKATKIIGCMLLASGVVASSWVGIKYALDYLKPKFFDVGEFNWTPQTTGEDVIDAIEKNEAITSFKNQSINFLLNKKYTYGLRVESMDKENATSYAYQEKIQYENEFNEQENKYLDEEYLAGVKKSRVSPFVSIYSELNKLNKKYDIDPIDYYQFKYKVLPQMKKDISKATKTRSQQISRKIRFLESHLDDKILTKNYDTFRFSKFLYDNSITDDVPEDEENEKDREEEKLKLVGNKVLKMVEEKEIILQDNPDFVEMLAPYTLTGNIGYSTKGYSVLLQEDMFKIILAKRDMLANSNFEKIGEQNPDASKPTTPKEQTYEPLSKVVSENEILPSFEKYEIIPGYTLRAKISNIDYASDSNVAKVSFILGVSATGQSASKIFWLESKTDETIPTEYLTGDFTVPSFYCKQNCANNFFYKNPIGLKCEKNSFDIQQIVNRVTITQLLEDAPTDANDHYLFSEKNPYLVDVSNMDLPGVLKPKQLENNHANEKIMLAISGVNTNFNDTRKVSEILANSKTENIGWGFQNIIPYVEAKWVIADLVPNTQNKEYDVIKPYYWITTANWVREVFPIYFAYSEQELALLQAASITTKLIRDFTVLAYDENGNKRNILQDIGDSTETTAYIDASLSGVLLGTSIVSDFAMCASALGVVGMGIAIFDSALDLALSSASMTASSAKLDMIPMMRNSAKAVEKFKELIPYDIAKAYADFYDKLHDASISVEAKLRIATISKNYLWVMKTEAIFKFFDYLISAFENKNFVEQARFWLEEFKNSSVSIRDFVFTNYETEKDIEKYLDYHNDNVYELFDCLEDEKAAELANLDEDIFYSFKFHNSFFSLFGVEIAGGFIVSKMACTTATYIILAKNIDTKKDIATRIVKGKGGFMNNKTNETFTGGHPSTEQLRGIEKEWQEAYPREAKLFDKAKKYLEPFERKGSEFYLKNLVIDEKKTITYTTEKVGEVEKTLTHNITNVDEYAKYINRKQVTSGFGLAQAILAGVIVLVSAAQMIVDLCLDNVVSEDKTKQIDKLQM